MKNLLCACSSIVVLAACGAAVAGGPDQFAAPTPPPPAPAIQYFDGLSIGVTGSFDDVAFANEVQYFDNAFEANGNGTSQTGYGGVQAKFGKVFQDMYYVGVQGYGKFGQAKDTFGLVDNITGQTVSANNPEIETQAGVNLVPGVVLGPDKRTLVYVKGGAVWGDITTDAWYVPTGTNVNEDEWEVGWQVGVGAERFIDENGNFSVNVDYTFSEFGDVDSGPSSDGVITKTETQVRDSAVTLGINYYPGFAL